jgi:thiamine biosynthesis lipoprotein ApbE
VRVRGQGPDGGAWTIAVEHPWSPEPLLHVGLHDGAVATSTTLRRAWLDDDGRASHHLIDPGTGEPSTSDLNLATVIAADAWMAEILAKSVLLRGRAHPFDLLGGSHAEGLAVDSTGRVLVSDHLEGFTGDLSPRPFVTDGYSVGSGR